MQTWREGFAEQLRMRKVEAEATPRRARGVVRGERYYGHDAYSSWGGRRGFG
ncbi:MAG: hypothetical protein ACREU2_17410 [Steroidobacteraceae bacterium]